MNKGKTHARAFFGCARSGTRQLKSDAPKVGGDSIACVSYFGFPEKMDVQAPEARERIERELLGS